MEAKISSSGPQHGAQYGPENPLDVEAWQATSQQLGLIERGQKLASLLWEQQRFISISPEALDRIPSAVLSVVEQNLFGGTSSEEDAGVAETTDVVRTDSTELDPGGDYPGKWKCENRTASIIACSVDETLTWRLVVIIEDDAGMLVGPTLGTPNQLLRAPDSMISNSDFVGIHMTITPPPSPLISEDIGTQAMCRLALLMAPTLELASLQGLSSLKGGKVLDIAKHVQDKTFPADAPAVDFSGKILQQLRAARLVFNTRLQDLPSVVVTYHQHFGVLGDFTVEGPFHPFSAQLNRHLTNHTPRSALGERITALDNPFFSDLLASRSNEQLSALAYAPVSLALRLQGLSPLSDEDQVVIHQTHLDQCDYRERTARCTVMLSIKRGSKWVVPASAGTARLSDEPEALIFSLHISSFKGEEPASIVAYALRRLNRHDTGGTVPAHIGFYCCALMLSPNEFAAQLHTLSNESPEQSILYRSFMTSLDTVFHTTDGGSPNIAWKWAKIDFISEPEQVTQNVGMLIGHSLGVSHFRVVRDKDTGVINLNTLEQPGDIHYMGSVPLEAATS
jgi:hypothetical protein